MPILFTNFICPIFFLITHKFKKSIRIWYNKSGETNEKLLQLINNFVTRIKKVGCKFLLVKKHLSKAEYPITF